jgi:putative SOS response-associated peptidase YedK
MPVIVAPDDYAAWLGERDISADAAKELLKPYPAAEIEMWPVDRRVGNWKNDDASLIEPAHVGEPAADAAD